MKLILSEEQSFLKETAKNFVSEKTPVDHFRKLRDNEDLLGWDKEIWSQMVALGWSGILVPEEFGGSNFGITGMSVIMQECGKNLTPSPLFATGVMGVSVLTSFGNHEQQEDLLPKIVNGEITTCLAIDEESHHDPINSMPFASQNGDSFILNGKKVGVVDGASADIIFVIARTSGDKGDKDGFSIFSLDAATTKNLDIQKLQMADHRNYANIYFNNVEVDSSKVIGDVNLSLDEIDKILDIGRTALSAEMLGSIEQAYSMTLEYLKERKQFGVRIGSFQALQHRAAEMFCEIELTKSAVMGAMKGIEENSNDKERLSSLAKTIVGETAHLVTNEAIQMHGGIGVTDEYDIGFYLKRARVSETILGSSTFHQERYAKLAGF